MSSSQDTANVDNIARNMENNNSDADEPLKNAKPKMNYAQAAKKNSNQPSSPAIDDLRVPFMNDVASLPCNEPIELDSDDFTPMEIAWVIVWQVYVWVDFQVIRLWRSWLINGQPNRGSHATQMVFLSSNLNQGIP